jgi:hypothetical protein
VVLGVQHDVLDVLALQEVGKMLGLLDGDRAHEHRTTYGIEQLDLLDDGVELLALGAINDVRMLDSDQGAIGRNHQHFELVDLVELGRFGFRRAGHAGQFLVHSEVILKGDRGKRLILTLDLHLLLGLYGLVESVRPATAGHQAAGELVDDDHLAVLDDVVDVALEEGMRAQGLIDVVQNVHVRRIPQVFDA